jgi:exosortase
MENAAQTADRPADQSILSQTRQLAAEVAAAWAQFPHRVHFWILLAGWLLLFHCCGNSTFSYVRSESLIAWLVHAYEWGVDDQHGLFIPLLVLVLLWWKRAELLPLPKQPCWPALLLLALAVGLHLLGFMAQQTRISVVGFFFGIYALTGVVWGWPWLKATAFPFCLLAFSVPLGALYEPLTFPLRQLSTTLTVGVAHTILGIPVIQNGVQILEPSGRFHYDVAPACSGIRSLTALIVLTRLYGMMFFKPYWQRGVILLVAIPAAIISNVLRLLIMVVAAQLLGQAGGNYVHDSAVLSFLPYVVGFVMVYWTGKLFQPRKPAAPQPALQPEAAQ